MVRIGIPLRYDFSKDEGTPIIYIFDSLRRTLVQMGVRYGFLAPLQDVDFINTRYKEMPVLTDEDKALLDSEFALYDGFIMPGGIKFTTFDMYLLEYAEKHDVPILGVCLSMQMMSCYREFKALERIEGTEHYQGKKEGFCHDVIIDKDSKLYSILGEEKIMVNSYHHFKVSDNHIYRTVGRCSDGVIEAMEHPSCTFNIGVQWHPEKDYSDPVSKKLLDAFKEACGEYGRNRKKNEE